MHSKGFSAPPTVRDGNYKLIYNLQINTIHHRGNNIVFSKMPILFVIFGNINRNISENIETIMNIYLIVNSFKFTVLNVFFCTIIPNSRNRR